MPDTKEFALRDGRILALRQPVPDDAEMLCEYPKIIGVETDYLLCDENGIPGLTPEKERHWIETTLTMPNTAMFVGFVEGGLACLCDVRAEGRPRLMHNAELSISVKKAYWGLGVGTVLMREMLAFARGTGTLQNLTLGVRADNERAKALYARFGFTVAGRYRRRMCVNGAYFDELMMELAL